MRKGILSRKRGGGGGTKRIWRNEMSKAVINIKVINQDRDSVKRQLSLSGQSEFNAKANHISFSDHPGDSTNSGGTLGSCLASIYLLYLPQSSFSLSICPIYLSLFLSIYLSKTTSVGIYQYKCIPPTSVYPCQHFKQIN